MTAQAEMHDVTAEVSFCRRCGYPIDPEETPAVVPDGYRRVANYEIERIHAALLEMAARKLPSPKSEDRVAKLLRRYFDVPHQVIEQRKKMAFQRFALSPDSTDETIPAIINEQRQIALHGLLHDTQDIPEIPETLLITANDLPSGKADPGGVAAIKFQLGFLYDLGDDD